MTSIANQNRPTTFSDYVGQEGATGYIQAVISNNKHPSGILIEGTPGTGKTTLAHLYVKATLCERREEGEFEPCGECDSCKSDIEKGEHANITYYRITEASTFKEAVSDLISITKASPVITHDNNRADNLRRFIIIDELQNASRQSISPFLDSLEFSADNVSVVLISMDLDKMDNVVRDAIESRCIELSLTKLNEKQISERLCSVEEDLHPSVSDTIAYLSKGNIRRAWSLLECLAVQKPVIELTEEFVSTQKMGGLSSDKCMDIVESLNSKTWNDTNKLLESISDNEVQAVDYFLNTIIQEDLNKEGIHFVSSLSIWLQSSYKIPLAALFRPFQSKQLIGALPLEETYTPAPYKKPASEIILEDRGVSKVHSNPGEVSKVTKDITNQLARISGKDITPPAFKCKALGFTKWSQFIEHYVDNN